VGTYPSSPSSAPKTRAAWRSTSSQRRAGRDALELVRRGDVTGASFGFKTVKDAWTRDGATTVRTLLDIEITEISLTALPSYQQKNRPMSR
jgi:HK97 family phage prohead protease